MDIATKRKKIMAHLDILSAVDPNGTNVPRYKAMFSKMSDQELDSFMRTMKEGRYQFNFAIPNMSNRLSLDEILATAKVLNVKLFDYVWMKDLSMGVRYRTRHKLPILKLPVRRLQQFLDKKLSVPDSDKKIDMVTGQVTGKDQSSTMSNPEIQSLYARGLTSTLNELVTVRGGDINAYGSLKASLEEQGSSTLASIPGGTVSRTAMVTSVLLASMHIDSNLVDA